MAAMDDLGRSEYTLEHKFRKWRQKGREIAEKNPEHAGSSASTPKKPRAKPVKKGANGKAKTEQADAGDEENGADGIADVVTVKQEEGKGMVSQNITRPRDAAKGAQAGIENEKPLPASKGKGKAVKANAVNDTKKRAAAKNGDANIKEGGSPAKKAKVTKKGTATVVKKLAAKPRESVSGDDGESGDEEEPEAQPSGKAGPKGQGKGANIEEDKPPVKKWKAEVLAEAGKIALKEELHGEDEDLNEMEFVQEA